MTFDVDRKRVVVVGGGRSGRAAAELLVSRGAEVVLSGIVARTPVGRELLGRAFDGHGAPADGRPPPVGEALRPVNGAPLNPVRRERPSDFIETGISAIDGLDTLVRGQKLPVFSGAGLPALELAAQIIDGARVVASHAASLQATWRRQRRCRWRSSRRSAWPCSLCR